MQKARNLNGSVVDGIDQNVGKWSDHEFSCPGLPADPAGKRELLQGLGCGVEPLLSFGSKGRMVKLQIGGNGFQVGGSSQRPPQASQLRIIRASRASISSS